MTTTDSTSAEVSPVGVKRHIGAPEIVARLEYIETAIFGSPLVVQTVAPPAPPPEPHECIPAIVKPDVSKAALSADKALAALILDEAKNLRTLRRLHEIACEVHKDPKSLTEEVRQEIHAAFNVMEMRYDSSGQTDAMEELSVLGEIAREAIGKVSGDQIPLSNGKLDVAWYGHVRGYLNGAKDIQGAIDRDTCEICLPNFIAMINADVARGLIRVTDGRYEWIEQ